ncbi:MAG: hypothetical protein LUI07_08115 [Lachnospiraceae bacterium]|nr:hypothetical protein [Lachnospiraceae bacterium]
MRFYSLTSDTMEPDRLAPDYRSAREIGVVRLGERIFYFRRYRKIYYIPYREIRRCFRRVMLVPARLCCGKGELSVENLVICGDKGELAQIQLPGERAGKALLEELKLRAPDADFGYWKKGMEAEEER